MSLETVKNKVKNKNLIIDELRKLDNFIEFKNLMIPIKKSLTTTINDLAILSSIRIFDINTYNKSNDSIKNVANEKDIKTVGMINIYNTSIVIFVYEYNDNYYLQFDDLPMAFWYRVNKINDLEVFVRYYINKKNIDNTQKKLKTIRYDLRRNDFFLHFMVERYMLISRYLEKTLHSTLCTNDYIDYAKKSYSTFDMATKYYDESLRQYEDESYKNVFELSSYSLYSNSYVTIQKTIYGVVAQVTYTPSECFSELITIINEHTDSTFDDDLPLDVVMFLLPFAPIDQKYLLSLTENGTKITINLINMLLWLRTDTLVDSIDDSMDRNHMIKILRNIYEKINSNINDYDDEEKYLTQSKIKRYINYEYIDIAFHDSKNQKNENGIEKKENLSENIMDKIFEIMKKNGDEKYIDKKFIKNVLYYKSVL